MAPYRGSEDSKHSLKLDLYMRNLFLFNIVHRLILNDFQNINPFIDCRLCFLSALALGVCSGHIFHLLPATCFALTCLGVLKHPAVSHFPSL